MFVCLFWKFCLRFFLVFFAEFELLIFNNNNVKTIDQAELVENLPPSNLPYRFLQTLHPIFLLENKAKIFDLKNVLKETSCAYRATTIGLH